MAEQQEAADLAMTDGRIYTVDDDNPWAEAVAVDGNKIVYMGNNEGAQAYVGEGTKVEDLGGKFMMPGMIATHEHSIFHMITSSGLNDKPRLTMGHTVMVTDEDLPRFKKLNVTANFYNWEAAQPNPEYLKRLGPKRYPHLLMREGSLLASGARVSFSQDWPTAPIDPLLHMHAAVTRSHIGEDEILGSEKDKVTLAQAIRAYTLDSACALATEDKNGSLEVGKWADFIILDRNPFEIPEDELPEVKVLRTVLDGRVVFDRAEKMGKKYVVEVKVTNPVLQNLSLAE